LGVSGQAFHSEEIVISNNPKGNKMFTNEIDNQTDQDQVHNFMIGPVYGHLQDTVTTEQADISFEEEYTSSDNEFDIKPLSSK